MQNVSRFQENSQKYGVCRGQAVCRNQSYQLITWTMFRKESKNLSTNFVKVPFLLPSNLETLIPIFIFLRRVSINVGHTCYKIWKWYWYRLMKFPSLEHVRILKEKIDIFFLNRIHYIFSKMLKLSNIGLKKSARSVLKTWLKKF